MTISWRGVEEKYLWLWVFYSCSWIFYELQCRGNEADFNREKIAKRNTKLIFKRILMTSFTTSRKYWKVESTTPSFLLKLTIPESAILSKCLCFSMTSLYLTTFYLISLLVRRKKNKLANEYDALQISCGRELEDGIALFYCILILCLWPNIK